jgi:hypothetical protein
MTKRSRILRSRRKGVGNEEGEGRSEEEKNGKKGRLIIRKRKEEGFRRRRGCKDRYDEEEGRRPLSCWIAIS